jgi:hypothetical protein
MFTQNITQTIRGVVADAASEAPIPFATLILLDTEPLRGATSDPEGNFVLEDVPVGRYDLQVSYLGYEPFVIRELMVGSGKEVVLDIALTERTHVLEEVVVRPEVNKEKSLNEMATVSARMLSVEEARRYAGGFDDPARLASAFAGVASNVGHNGIIVRGNAPRFLQWKMEGVEIPNPNHFADLTAFGGGGLTALSSQMLANSDFFTGAFPAEYGNALSGVFDIFMRNGNRYKHEHSFQLGLIGIDASSEGPLDRKKRSSYLFNYRYSTVALLTPLLPEDAGGTRYQDLAFKLHFPTEKSGVFSLWGFGLIDRSGQTAETDPALWRYEQDKEEQDARQYTGAAGVSHKYFLTDRIFLKSTLAATVNGIRSTLEQINEEQVLLPKNEIGYQAANFVFSSFLQSKINALHTNKTGFVVTGLNYHIGLDDAPSPGASLQSIVDETGFSSLLSAYSQSTVRLGEKWQLNAGLHGQLFTLNHHYAIEPRLGLRWQYRPDQALSLAYGGHSRLERLNYYFTRTETGKQPNRNLDFTRAHHLVVAFDWSLTKDWRLKLEGYYQHLYQAPVIPDSSYSFLNLENDWFFNAPLTNDGQGRNTGVDLTLEKYLSNGFYFLFSGSVFDSKYRGGDGIWRDTRYNRNYVFNILAGKEWMVGRQKQNVLGVNGRVTYQGGDRYTPYRELPSLAAKEIILDGDRAFSQQFPAALLAHLTISYQVNKARSSREWALKVINATGFKEFYGYRYNFLEGKIDERREALVIPNLSYKISF